MLSLDKVEIRQSGRDYRALLRDYFAEKKKCNPRWSYAVWARHLGLRSPSMLHMILHGSRHPGEKLTRKIATSMKMTEVESKYFEDLVRAARCHKDPHLAAILLERIERSWSGDSRKISEQTFASINKWYHYVLRELIRMPFFREDYSALKKGFTFPIDEETLRGGVKNLIEAGLLVRDATMKLILSDSHIETENDIPSETLKRFHEQALSNARISIREVAPQNREITGTTFPIKLSSVPRAKELIRRFQNDLCDLIEDQNGNAIFHLEIALYPTYIAPESNEVVLAPLSS